MYVQLAVRYVKYCQGQCNSGEDNRGLCQGTGTQCSRIYIILVYSGDWLQV